MNKRDVERARRGAEKANRRLRDGKATVIDILGRHPTPATKFVGARQAMDDLNRAWPDPWGGK